MSKYFEIIDPSLDVLLEKTTSQTSLINENKNLKNLNVIIILSAAVILSIGYVYYQSRDKEDKHMS